MFIELAESALRFGFVNDTVGTHGSRTIMLKELRQLLSSCPPGTSYEDFRTAIIDDNILLKNTDTTRKESFRRLRELYSINEEVLLFRALRDLWTADADSQPLIALLCATARDSILRGTADLILSTPIDDPVTPEMIEKATEESFPHRYSSTTLANVGRHAASSWQQSGHLHGRQKKVRTRTHSTSPAAAYALFLGYLCGARGDALFQTIWARLLDVPTGVLHGQASVASQQGWLEYRHSGAVTEITFRHLLRNQNQDDAA